MGSTGQWRRYIALVLLVVTLTYKTKMRQIYSLLVLSLLAAVVLSAENQKPRMANQNCHIRGREDDLNCSKNGEKIEKLTYVVGEMVGLAVLCYVYKMVNNDD